MLRGADGRTWRESEDLAAQMFAVLPVMRQLHEILWHLTEGAELAADGPLAAEVAAARARTQALAEGSVTALRGLDVGAHRAAASTWARPTCSARTCAPPTSGART